MDQKIITNYINTFRNHLGKYLIPGIGVSINISELPDGVFICVTLATNILDATKFRAHFNNIAAAMTFYGFDITQCNVDNCSDTTVIIQSTRLAVVKNYDPGSWTDDVAKNDVERIVTHIRNSKKK